jgi:hypothetical protein
LSDLKGEKIMVNNPILARFPSLAHLVQSKRLNLHDAFHTPSKLPAFVLECPSAMRALDLLGPLAWGEFPERNLIRNWGKVVVPHAAFSAACLLKLNENLVSMGDLRQYLVEHPAFIWLLGFPLTPSLRHPCGFDPHNSLPTERHLTRMLREASNRSMQFLFEDSVRLLFGYFASQGIRAGECISLDTKHILAWVRENNPKAYVESRFDKTKQPKGDPDCKLGCKRRHNQVSNPPSETATPRSNPIPAKDIVVGEFYWGYGSGTVVAKIPEYGEFVIAELTQTFDKSDVSYFFPLMQKTEQILGFQPRFGTFDAAFDAWYVYDYFHREDDPDAFAAVPYSMKGGYKANERLFTSEGLPICKAGLAMPLQFTYLDRTVSIIEHERGKYVCPLMFPERADRGCPIQHEKWGKKGCTVTMSTSPGARLRYSLDRESQIYKNIYKQRTAVERINSQAYALGIERPHIRNGAAIANLNTLIYTLINLRLYQRLRQKR